MNREFKAGDVIFMKSKMRAVRWSRVKFCMDNVEKWTNADLRRKNTGWNVETTTT